LAYGSHREAISDKRFGGGMEDLAYIYITIRANEEQATEALKQAASHLMWGGIEVLAGGVTNEE